MVPLIARLFPSVPPEVKNISLGVTWSNSATILRDFSTATLAVRPYKAAWLHALLDLTG